MMAPSSRHAVLSPGVFLGQLRYMTCPNNSFGLTLMLLDFHWPNFCQLVGENIQSQKYQCEHDHCFMLQMKERSVSNER